MNAACAVSFPGPNAKGRYCVPAKPGRMRTAPLRNAENYMASAGKRSTLRPNEKVSPATARPVSAATQSIFREGS